MNTENTGFDNEIKGEAEVPMGFAADENGMLHWVYHKKLWRTAYIPLRVFAACVILGAVLAAANILITKNLTVSLYMAGVMGCAAVLAFIIWVVRVLVAGGEQCFKMALGEDRAVSALLPRASRWARTLQDAAEPYGVMSNDMRIVISCLNSVSRKSHVTKLNEVKQVKRDDKRDAVILKAGLSKRILYARSEQIDFVYDYLKERCTQAVFK